MARPRKAGLDFYYKDVDTWDDFRIMDLVNEYGPLGYAIYDIVRDKVYKNSYYLEVPLDKLVTQIVRIIGNRWIKDKRLVLQVIQYCADLGLFDKAFLSQSVITSVEIQQHYSEVTARNKADKSKYWLLEKNNPQAALETTPKTEVFAAETPINTTEISINTTSIPQSKLNEIKSNESKATTDAREEFCRAIESEFGKLTGKLISSTDARSIYQLYDDCTDTALIIEAMQIAAKTYKPKYNGDRIYSFKYFVPAIRDAIEKKNGDGDHGTNRNTDSNSGGISNRFGIQEEYL